MQKTLDIQSVPFRGGCNTYLEPALLEPGKYSAVQNFRQMHPGLKKRPGQIKLHSTADGTNRVMSLFQFSKGKTTERHFYAQMSDGDVLEATTAPPGVTTGAFGSEVHDGTSSGMVPASWSVFNETLLYSNGSDQHQIYYGQTGRISKFIFYVSAAAFPMFPVLGVDYTDEVTDGLATTYASLDSMGTLAQYDCVFFCAPIPINKITWTIVAANADAAVAVINYRKNDNTWAAAASLTDNTIASAGKTLGQSGTMTWTKPTDSIPTYMFGVYGYWYQFGLSSGALDAEVEVSALTFESDWTSLSNMWDGVLVDGVEAQFYDHSATTYYTYGTTSIDITVAMATDDYLYIAFTDPQEGVYFDVGETPSTTASNTIDGFDYWNGTAWATVGTFTDGTVGLTQSGYIVLPKRAAGLEQPVSFRNTQYYAYWYRLSVNKALSAKVNVGVRGMPTYSISDFGQKGVCSCAWKNRMVYTFDQWPNYIYITAEGNPQCLNGDDYDIKSTGDGRANKIVCMKPFYNELMVFQEERGVEGGTISIFDGYNPSTFGRLVLSSKYGTMNAHSAVVVEGFSFGGQKDAGLVAFFLSRSGILYTEGKTVSHVPNFDEIRNYFDPTNANCIRTGYESHMWLKYDSAFNILRIGLVTGSGTVCNTFLTYDLTDLSWGTDVYAQALGSFTECEAASGTAPVLQVAGGVSDGTVYLSNSGLNDVTTAIDSFVTPEYDVGGNILQFDEVLLRVKAQSAGSVTITPSLNAIAQTSFTLAQTPEITNQTIRRHRKGVDLKGQHVSLKIQHNTAGESCHLSDLCLKIRELSEQ